MCCLLKALYRLRQAPRIWYERIDSFFIEHNFNHGNGDTNLYIHTEGDQTVILALYVDDILLTGSSIELILSTKSVLETTFEMSEIGDGTIALYLQVECICIPQGIFMSQRGYCRQILEQFGMMNVHQVATPMIEYPRLVSNMQ